MKWLNLTVNEMNNDSASLGAFSLPDTDSGVVNDDSASLGAFSLPDTYSGVVKAVLSNLSNAMARNLPNAEDKL